MRITPDNAGGRTISGDTPWGRFTIELSAAADGRSCVITDEAGAVVGAARIDFARPAPASPPPTDEEIDQRAAVCSGCPHNKGLRRQAGRFPVDLVKCGLCGCAALSLRNGRCPRKLW